MHGVSSTARGHDTSSENNKYYKNFIIEQDRTITVATTAAAAAAEGFVKFQTGRVCQDGFDFYFLKYFLAVFFFTTAHSLVFEEAYYCPPTHTHQ